jgi:hypothetical protein
VAPAGKGITLDQYNGSLSENGTTLVKGFNPTNPHVGDAIVATFFWLGSTNIITSVTDVLTTNPYTPVGNTYTLVDYVALGGTSMATYVATNVQNFPDPNDPASGIVLAVQATLSSPVTDGGVLISAWTGVNAVSAQALGAHHSASGSGSTSTVADPGAITIGAGALAYAVTMSNGHVGRQPPAGFTNLDVLSDPNIVSEADDAVQASAGSVDPQWTWLFNSPSSWLATVLALNPASGNLTVTTSTSGSSLPSGYTVAVDGGAGQPIGINGSVPFTNLAAGSHSVVLSGVPSNCTVSGGNTQTVTVPSGGTATAAFSVSCITPNVPPTVNAGSNQTVLLAVLYSLTDVSFTDPDNDGPWSYTINWGDGSSSSGSTASQGPITGTHTYLLLGTYTITIVVTDSRGASGSGSKRLTVIL